MKESQRPATRKAAHLALATNAQTQDNDKRFDYEPLLTAHPQKPLPPQPFLGKTIHAPIWVSSMTGGTSLAYTINHRLAQACRTFGMGMGLGSCRVLLEDDTRLKDFDLRSIIGPEQLLFANLGIAQIEQAMLADTIAPINQLVERLQADGLIIHINPLQEWLQPEGNRFTQPPLTTLKAFLKAVNYPVIVKEVGQGMGPASIKALLQLPLAALDFAAFGGTNFAKVELLRKQAEQQTLYAPLSLVGHTAEEMVHIVNQQIATLGPTLPCQHIIISGGVKSFLDGYYLTNLVNRPAIYGQAAVLLQYAKISYKALSQYLAAQIQGFAMAQALLRVKQ